MQRVQVSTSGRARGLGAGRAAGVLVAVAALGLGGCSPREPGAAAVVGDRRITTQQVADAVRGIKAGNPQVGKTEQLERTVLYFLVLAPYVADAARDEGVAVSDAQAEALLSESSDPDPDAVMVFRTFLALRQLQEARDTEGLDRLQQRLAAAAPDINPRYGVFDAREVAIVDTNPNWLEPTASPTPTGSGAP
ncbi:MAG: SurA N-terminal domain-containing protein [Angustibacter sp.]